MQKPSDFSAFAEITPSARVATERHGWRAKCLQRLVRLDLPVPLTVALPCDTVRAIAAGTLPDTRTLIGLFGDEPLVSVRPSPADPEWGGPSTILNVGMNAARHAALTESHGAAAADALYLAFVQAFAVHVARLDPEMFAAPPGPGALDRALAAYEAEMEAPFPEDPARQLAEVLRSMARAWEGTTARLLRQAKGAPAEAPLGLVVQRMALGIGPGLSGVGTIQLVDPVTGQRQVTGRFHGQSLAPKGGAAEETLYLTRDARGPSLEQRAPEVFAELVREGEACRARLREEMQIEFAIESGTLRVIDATRVARSSRASVRIAVTLAEAGIIAPDEAVLRVEPRALSELLHHQVDPRAPRDRIARGIPASPGAATGRIVFTSAAAQASAARGEDCILIRRETAPEDIRGMHAASAVVTERGGMTSHAAVIARGLGLPCIVGASDLRLDPRDKVVIGPGGRRLGEGEVITVDGTSGEILAGSAEMLPPALDEAFHQLLAWADAARDIGVRANADTPDDARTARDFAAEGIGLCRTEHMFFEEDRLTVMREMIFADTAKDRKVALDRLLPMQRADFIALFDIMAGLPVCIRLFDPPLHEFLPHEAKELETVAASLGVPVEKLSSRVSELAEFNPMLGFRGCRIAIRYPEIPEMQARAIFEAAVNAGKKTGKPVKPEVMIPLVVYRREFDILAEVIRKVAKEVEAETGATLDYDIGTMVELPRCALIADKIAEGETGAEFFSFGTNDMTQTALGLSRDDAGPILESYVSQGIFEVDPFVSIDVDGVGELVRIGTERGRRVKPDLKIGICGEHGGDPKSVTFCHESGLDYVSCSPFRVPVARLSAAHAALKAKAGA